MKKNKISFATIAFIVLLLTTVFINDESSGGLQGGSSVPISEFVSYVDNGNIEEAFVENESIVARTYQGQILTTSYPYTFSNIILDKLLKSKAKVKFRSAEASGGISKIIFLISNIFSWIPMLFIGFFLYNMFKQNNGGGKSEKKGGGLFGGNLFQVNKNKAQRIMPDAIKVKLKDVQGIDEAKSEVAEIIDFLQNPEYYKKIGGVVPKGCLMVGSPGTGKTMLAKAIAAEAKVPFFFISGSDFVEMFVGVGAGRVRSLFAEAQAQSPCIVFIDEIDAVGRQRGSGLGGGNDEREQTLNQLLVEMDGFKDNGGVIVIAATNRADVLDKALLRPGRFDRQINVPLPDLMGRKSILEIHTSKIVMSSDVDLMTIARGTPGFSGAELANLANEAALIATKSRKNIVTYIDFEEAKDKIIMGTARKSVMKQKEKDLTAYHEGGHALVALKSKASDPIHKATIVPRGRALGVVVRLPKDDKFSMTLAEMKTNIAVAMAGRVAEEIIFGQDEVTSGASSDIQMATSIARSMVMKWGFSEKVGHVFHSDEVPSSEGERELIDKEIKILVDQGYKEAFKIINENISDLHKIAKSLLERETLTGAELQMLIDGKDLPPILNSDQEKPSKSHSRFVKNKNKDNKK